MRKIYRGAVRRIVGLVALSRRRLRSEDHQAVQ
jgi:hypothetical protein